MNVPTPYYPQLEERDCGATCLRMVAEHYGRDVSMEQLRELTDTDARGTDLGGIERGAQHLSFETLAAEIPFDELAAGDLLPVILHWDRDHFVVVVEADFAKVKVHDPAVGVRELTRDDFESHRYGPGRSRAGLILRPQPGQASEPEQRALLPPAAPVAAAPYGFILSGIVFSAMLALALGILYVALVQAIDLQFREGWLQHLGALLLAAAGLALASLVLRRQAIAYASRRGQMEVERIVEHIRVRTADIRRPINAETYLTLLQDSDQLRVWRAYAMATVVSGAAVLICILVYMAYLDWVWALSLLGSLLLIWAIGSAVYRYGQRNQEAAREAQLKQREAVYEYAHILPDVTTIDSNQYLDSRLVERNERAEAAFHRIAAEYSAERQLVRVAMLLSVVALTVVGFYRLGYSGLQLGELTFGYFLIVAAMMPLLPMCSASVKWKKLQASRLRLADLGEPGLILDKPRGPKPRQITLTWDARNGAPQQVSFPSNCRVALVGSDHVARDAVVAGMLGRDNVFNAKMYIEDDLDEQVDVTVLGKVSHITPQTAVASGSLATNIALTQRPDERAVANAARVAGIAEDAPPRGLHTLVGFDGEGIEQETVTRTLIARAVYAGVDALLLDRATQSLDDYEEGLLMDRLIPWCEGRLLVVNPTRVNAAYGCDLLIHVEEGEIDAVGSHESLIRERGAYYYEVIAAQDDADEH